MAMAKSSADMKQLALCSFVEAVMVNTLLAVQNSLTCLLMLTGSLLNDELPDLNGKRFPMEELYRVEKPGPENQDASDTEDDDEEDEDDNGEADDDAGDEDFSGGEEAEDDEGDPEEDAEANGDGGSDDEDDDDDDGDDEDEDGDEDEDEEDEDEEDQPPAKKRK